MYEFELQKNEKIELISDESLLWLKEEVIPVSIIITNKRFLIFDFPKDIESFRFGRMINYPNPPKKEIIFETNLDNIKKIVKTSDFVRYILKNDQFFCLADKNVYQLLKKINK